MGDPQPDPEPAPGGPGHTGGGMSPARTCWARGAGKAVECSSLSSRGCQAPLSPPVCWCLVLQNSRSQSNSSGLAQLNCFFSPYNQMLPSLILSEHLSNCGSFCETSVQEETKGSRDAVEMKALLYISNALTYFSFLFFFLDF